MFAHIGGWLLFQSLPLVFLLTNSNGNTLSQIISTREYWQFCFYFIIIFYLHTNWLLPQLFIPAHKLLYLAVLLLLLYSVFLLHPFERLVRANFQFQQLHGGIPKLPPNDRFPMRDIPANGRFGPRPERKGIDIISVVLLIMTITISFVIDLTRRWRETAQRAFRAEADKANAELSFLKAQINPHFLFNTLNNIYSMAVTKNENTAGSIMKLSNIMRYVTDDVNEDFVSLRSEVDCISDYIDLQRLRLGKKVSLEFRVTGDLENKTIAPLILMTFIENLFKYGISNHEQSPISIQLDVTQDRLHFISRNRLFATDRKIDRTGIGIGNTKKRLEHLYPGKHRLEIIRENGYFVVDLTIED